MCNCSVDIWSLVISGTIGVFTGCISSFIVWYIPTRKIIPKLSCDSFIGGEGKWKITVSNKSKYDAYDISCYVEYLNKSGDLVFSETRPVPILKGYKETQVSLKSILDNSKRSNDSKTSRPSFIKQETTKIRVTITCQSKFGSREVTESKEFSTK